MENIVIIGSGGLAKEIKYLIDTINRSKDQWNLIGFIDDWEKQKGDEFIDGYKVVGTIEDLNKFKEECFATIAIGNPQYIKAAAEKINNRNIKFANLIHPTAEINSRNIGFGNIICFDSFISCNVKIGNFNVFNGCVVGHDAHIGDFNSFMPGVKISGDTRIGNENYFGVSSVLLQKKEVGNRTVIGAGSVVIRSTKDDSTYIGNPAIKLKY